MSSENSFRESSEFFIERARRIAQKVTALSRRDDLNDEEKVDLEQAIKLSTVYSQLGLGYSILASLDYSEKETNKKLDTLIDTIKEHGVPDAS